MNKKELIRAISQEADPMYLRPDNYCKNNSYLSQHKLLL